jgi:hypothetical protein
MDVWVEQNKIRMNPGILIPILEAQLEMFTDGTNILEDPSFTESRWTTEGPSVWQEAIDFLKT